MTADDARMLVMSPLCRPRRGPGAQARPRLLRRLDREADLGERLPQPSGELLRQALRRSGRCSTHVDDRLAARPRKLAGLLAKAARGAEPRVARPRRLSGSLWAGTTLAASAARCRRARRRRRAGRPPRPRRDLCAVRSRLPAPRRSGTIPAAADFLDEVEAQQIPADTLAERGVRGDSVRLLTAHRSKGLEWRIVVVAGVQEGSWPDLRRRGSLLQADRLGPDGLVDPLPTTAMLAEERRLFYVAVTRARQRLIVTAVASPEADGDQPSRLIEELGLRPSRVPGARPAHVAGRARLRAAPGRIRSASRASRCVEPQPPGWRDSVETEVAGEPLVPAADPASWWGLRASHDERRTRAARATSRCGFRPAPLAACSTARCGGSCLARRPVSPRREHRARVRLGHPRLGRAHEQGRRRSTRTAGRPARLGVGPAAVRQPVDRRARAARRGRGAAPVRAWHDGRPGRTYLGAEEEFEVEVPLDGGETVSLRGEVDRVERDSEGSIVIVDFKTSKTRRHGTSNCATTRSSGSTSSPSTRAASTSSVGADARSGGAELVQLRVDKGGFPKVQAQGPQQPDDSEGRKPIEVQLIDCCRRRPSRGLRRDDEQLLRLCEFARCARRSSRAGTVLS